MLLFGVHLLPKGEPALEEGPWCSALRRLLVSEVHGMQRSRVKVVRHRVHLRAHVRNVVSAW